MLDRLESTAHGAAAVRLQAVRGQGFAAVTPGVAARLEWVQHSALHLPSAYCQGLPVARTRFSNPIAPASFFCACIPCFQAELAKASAPDLERRLQEAEGRIAAKQRGVDVVIAMDLTGSMVGWLGLAIQPG